MKHPRILEDILRLAAHEKERGHRLKAIFDLDSTLYDVSPRIAKILHAFAEIPEIKKEYPKEAALLATVEPHPLDYGVKRTLMRYKFVPPGEEFVKKLVSYWKKQFFGSEYLKFDVPYPGAREYVRKLYEAGADILYLSGRDVPRMHKGSVESLVAHDFPLDRDHANLVLKPSPEIKDTTFKRDFFKAMDRSAPEVWFFENEPANIHLVLENSPHIKVVFVETVHSGSMPIPGDHVPRISGFVE